VFLAGGWWDLTGNTGACWLVQYHVVWVHVAWMNSVQCDQLGHGCGVNNMAFKAVSAWYQHGVGAMCIIVSSGMNYGVDRGQLGGMCFQHGMRRSPYVFSKVYVWGILLSMLCSMMWALRACLASPRQESGQNRVVVHALHVRHSVTISCGTTCD
jgi:hypothetical protein